MIPFFLALLEDREHSEDAGQILGEKFRLADDRTHLQVFLHRHAREDAAALG